MATLSELFISDIQKQNSEGGLDTMKAMQTGAQLAQVKLQKEQQAAQIQQKQQELQLAKLEKISTMFDNATKMEGSLKRAYVSGIPNAINALGMGDVFHPEVIKMGQAEPMALTYMAAKVQEDPSYLTKIVLPALGDMEKFGTLMASPEYSQFKGTQLTQEMAQDSISMLKKQFDIGNANAEKMARAQAAADATAANRGAGEKRFEKTNLIKLGEEIEKEGLVDWRISVNDLDRSVPGGLEGWKSGTKIPGISDGAGALPLNRLGGKGREVRLAAQALANQVLKARNGGAITPSEAERTLTELGMSPAVGEGGTWTGLIWKGISDEGTFVSGMRRAKRNLEGREQLKKNTYGKAAWSEATQGVTDINTAPRNVDLKAKARAYIEKFGRNAKGSAAALKVLGE